MPPLCIRLRPGRRVQRIHGHRLDGSPSLGTVRDYLRTDSHGDWYSIAWDCAPDLAPAPCCRSIFRPLRTTGRNSRPLMQRPAL